MVGHVAFQSKHSVFFGINNVYMMYIESLENIHILLFPLSFAVGLLSVALVSSAHYGLFVVQMCGNMTGLHRAASLNSRRRSQP